MTASPPETGTIRASVGPLGATIPDGVGVGAGVDAVGASADFLQPAPRRAMASSVDLRHFWNSDDFTGGR